MGVLDLVLTFLYSDLPSRWGLACPPYKHAAASSRVPAPLSPWFFSFALSDSSNMLHILLTYFLPASANVSTSWIFVCFVPWFMLRRLVLGILDTRWKCMSTVSKFLLVLRATLLERLCPCGCTRIHADTHHTPFLLKKAKTLPSWIEFLAWGRSVCHLSRATFHDFCVSLSCIDSLPFSVCRGQSGFFMGSLYLLCASPLLHTCVQPVSAADVKREVCMLSAYMWDSHCNSSSFWPTVGRKRAMCLVLAFNAMFHAHCWLWFFFEFTVCFTVNGL